MILVLHFVEAYRGGAPSYTWRSIWGAKALLLEGLKWRVGNGEKIYVWNDAWLYDVPYKVPSPNLDHDPQMRVKDLIDRDAKRWDADAVKRILNVSDARQLQSIPISHRLPEDVLIWWPAKDGIFTVKSAYWLGKSGAPIARGRNSAESNEIWKVIWDNNFPPKLKHLLWRLCSDCVPYGELLCRRHINSDPGCLICGQQMEDLMHAIFECHHVREVWNKFGLISDLSDAPNSSFAARLCWMARKVNEAEFERFCAVIWGCWTARNKMMYGDGVRDTFGLVEGFIQYVKDSRVFRMSTNMTRGRPVRTSSLTKWMCPEPGFVKMNWDAAVFDDKVGLGVVIRGEEGDIQAILSEKIDATMDPSLAEAAAALAGIKLCIQLGARRVLVEGDALNIVTAIKNGRTGLAVQDLIVDDIRALGALFECVEFGHVKRSGNTLAHRVARLCFETNGRVELYQNFPDGVLSLAVLDLI